MDLEVVVGTYEQLILGFKLDLSNEGVQFEPSFTDHSHVGLVRCVAVSSGGVLASGSSDEVIHLFNLTKRRELGTLMHHEGSVNALEFHDKKTMLSCSDDGTLGIWRVGAWECLRTLRGHKGAVYALSIHPSGKLALSVSRDQTMRTWNLITGKCAYVTKLKKAAELVRWSPGGEHYVIVTDTTADIYSVQTAGVVKSITFDCRIHAMAFPKDDVVLFAGEKGTVYFHSVPSGEFLFEFSTQTNRVKSMQLCELGGGDAKIQALVTGSSDGWIKIWELSHAEGRWSASLLASIDTKFRILSLAVHKLGTEAPHSTTATTNKSRVTQSAQAHTASSDEHSDGDASDDDSDDASGDGDDVSIDDSDNEDDVDNGVSDDGDDISDGDNVSDDASLDNSDNGDDVSDDEDDASGDGDDVSDDVSEDVSDINGHDVSDDMSNDINDDDNNDIYDEEHSENDVSSADESSADEDDISDSDVEQMPKKRKLSKQVKSNSKPKQKRKSVQFVEESIKEKKPEKKPAAKPSMRGGVSVMTSEELDTGAHLSKKARRRLKHKQHIEALRQQAQAEGKVQTPKKRKNKRNRNRNKGQNKQQKT